MQVSVRCPNRPYVADIETPEWQRTAPPIPLRRCYLAHSVTFSLLTPKFSGRLCRPSFCQAQRRHPPVGRMLVPSGGSRAYSAHAESAPALMSLSNGPHPATQWQYPVGGRVGERAGDAKRSENALVPLKPRRRFGPAPGRGAGPFLCRFQSVAEVPSLTGRAPRRHTDDDRRCRHIVDDHGLRDGNDGQAAGRADSASASARRSTSTI